MSDDTVRPGPVTEPLEGERAQHVRTLELVLRHIEESLELEELIGKQAITMRVVYDEAISGWKEQQVQIDAVLKDNAKTRQVLREHKTSVDTLCELVRGRMGQIEADQERLSKKQGELEERVSRVSAS